MKSTLVALVVLATLIVVATIGVLRGTSSATILVVTLTAGMAACVAAALCGSTWDGGFILAGKIAAGYIGAAFAIGSSSRPAGFIIAGAAAANVVAVWVAYEFKRSHIHRQAIRRLAL